MDEDTFNHIHSLEREVKYLRTLLRPTDTGHISTTISVLEFRVKQLYDSLELEPIDDSLGYDTDDSME
jgi:hypothetical protein